MDASVAIGLDAPLQAPDEAILIILQRGGPMTAQALACAAVMSRTAVLRRLAALGRAGMVERRSVRRGVGRPRHLYDVTLDAQGRLGTEYGALVSSLFDAIVEVGGHELVARLFGARRRRATALIRSRLDEPEMREAPLAERARAVAGWHEEHGFAADVSETRGLRIRVHNCPILRMAVATPAVCDAELRMMADVLDADVERESLIATGARRCIYRVMPRADGAQAPAWRAAQMRTDGSGDGAQAAVDAAPVWRRESMSPARERARTVRATRWPPTA